MTKSMQYPTLLMLFSLISTINAAASMTFVQNNGSMDGYYVPVKDDGNDSSSTTAKPTETYVSTGKPTQKTTATMSLVLNEIVSSSLVQLSTESSSTPELETSSEASKTTVPVVPSTTVWWTPESLISKATESTTDKTSTVETSSKSDTITTSTSEPINSPTKESTPAITSSTKTKTTSETDTGKCQTEWGQCGGENYSGVSCCQDGYTCIAANSYWARCVAASTLVSQGLTGSGTGTVNATGKNDKKSVTKSPVVQTYTSASTLYDYSTSLYEQTVVTSDENNSKITTVLESTSINKVVKGVSSVIEFTTVSNGAIQLNTQSSLSTMLLALISFLI